MKKTILILLMIIILGGCMSKHGGQTDNVYRYQHLLEEKEKLSKEYVNYLQNPEGNKDKITELDKKLHDINIELKELRQKSDVMEYTQVEFQRQYGSGNSNMSSNSVGSSSNSYDIEENYDVNKEANFDTNDESGLSNTDNNEEQGNNEETNDEVDNDQEFRDDSNDYEDESFKVEDQTDYDYNGD